MKNSVIANDLDMSISLFAKLDRIGTVQNIVSKARLDLSFRLMEDLRLPFTNKIVEAYDKGDIILVYNDRESIGGIAPIYPRANKSGKPVAIVNITTYATEKDGNIRMRSPELLYNLLIAAYTAKRVMSESQYIYRSSHSIRMTTMEAYVKMMMSCFSRMGSANDTRVRDKIRYMVGMFFNVGMCGVSYDIAKEGVANILKIDKEVYLPIMMKYTDADFAKFDKLLEVIAEECKHLKDVQIPKFIELTQRLFGSPAVMAIDYLPYMAMMVMSQGKAKFAMYENSNLSRELGVELLRAYADLADKVLGR